MLGRTWDAATGTITEAQEIGKLIFEYNLDWRYSLVSSCDNGTQLADAIRYLADQMASTGCCNTPGTVGGPGTGGSGNTTSPPIDDIDPQGDPPEGYETWTAYRVDKCNKAWWLVNTISDDLARMGQLQFAGATALSLLPLLAAFLLDPIPGDELFLIAGLLITMAFYGATTLQQTRESFNDAKSNIVCELYNANGPDAGKTAALSSFREQIESDTADLVVVEYGVQLISLMLSWDGLNKVYEFQEGVTYPTGDDDCSGCIEQEFIWTGLDLVDAYRLDEVWTIIVTSMANPTFNLSEAAVSHANAAKYINISEVTDLTGSPDPDGLGVFPVGGGQSVYAWADRDDYYGSTSQNGYSARWNSKPIEHDIKFVFTLEE
jgi:hypothetical protein